MRTNFRIWLRAVAVMLAIGFAAPSAVATGATGRTQASTPAPRRETLWGLPRDDPAIAVGAIIGGVALLILFAWIAVRVSDKE